MTTESSRPRSARRTSGFARTLVCSFVATACAARDAPAPQPLPEPATKAPVDAPRPAPVARAPAAAPMPEPLPVELDAIDPAPAPNAAVRLEIQSPRLGQRIAQNRVDRTPVKLALRGAGPNHRLQVQLDAHAPREVGPAGGIALRELIPEEMTFEPGLHSLHAFIVDERGVSLKPAVEHTVLPYATVQFWIGEGDGTTSAVSEPSIVYLLPRGTYNGAAAADSAVLDFYLFNTRLDADEHRVKVDVSSGGRSRQFVLSEWRAWRIAGLPSGDYRVELTLVDASNEPVQSPVSRVITVNRDAPEDPAP